jgi:hypothetical protein
LNEIEAKENDQKANQPTDCTPFFINFRTYAGERIQMVLCFQLADFRIIDSWSWNFLQKKFFFKKPSNKKIA